MSDDKNMKLQKATFAAGCFWHVEEAFRRVPGVASTAVGYEGGTMENPTYRDVCTDKTGHAEAVEVTYDPSKVSYEDTDPSYFTIIKSKKRRRKSPKKKWKSRAASRDPSSHR